MFKFTKHCVVYGATLLMLLLSSCDPKSGDDSIYPGTEVQGVFVMNEGSYGTPNSASLSIYNPLDNSVIEDIYAQGNTVAMDGMPSSIAFMSGKGYITATDKGKILVIDPKTGKQSAEITGLSSPRNIIGVNNDILVSNLYSNQIDIIDANTLKAKGKIELAKGEAAEFFVRIGDFIYTNFWSFGNSIAKISIQTMSVVKRVEVGVQPMTLFVDANMNLWTMTDGGFQGNPLGYEDPKLVCLDKDLNILKSFSVKRDPASMGVKMMMKNGGSTIYYSNYNVYKFNIDDDKLPVSHFVNTEGKSVYALGVDPINDDLYIGDAKNFVSKGAVHRYDKDGKLVNSFNVGINPNGFTFFLN